jgi:hypothetical protein
MKIGNYAKKRLTLDFLSDIIEVNLQIAHV